MATDNSLGKRSPLSARSVASSPAPATSAVPSSRLLNRIRRLLLPLSAPASPAAPAIDNATASAAGVVANG